MKKITHLLVLGFFLFIGTNINAQTISLDSLKVCPGETVTIPVTLTDNDAGFQYLFLNFNLSGWPLNNLTFTDGSLAGSASGVTHNASTGEFTFFLSAPPSDDGVLCLSGDNILFNIVFDVPFGVTGCIDFTVPEDGNPLYNNTFSCDEIPESNKVSYTKASICIDENCVLEECCDPDAGEIVIDIDPETFTIVCMEGYEDCEDVTYRIDYYALSKGGAFTPVIVDNCIGLPCDIDYVVVIVADNEECGLEYLEAVYVPSSCEGGGFSEDNISNFIQNNGIEKIKLTDASERSSIDEEINSFKISPNPFTQDVQIQLSSNKEEAYQLTIFNLEGKVVSSTAGSLNKGNNKISINELRGVTNGFYFYQLNTTSNNYSGKVLKVNQ